MKDLFDRFVEWFTGLEMGARIMILLVALIALSVFFVSIVSAAFGQEPASAQFIQTSYPAIPVMQHEPILWCGVNEGNSLLALTT